MAQRAQKHRRSIRSFFILVAVVIVGGLVLWSQGDLISPVESTAMLIGMSSGESGFAMVGDRPAPSDQAGNDTGTTTVAQTTQGETAGTAASTTETVTTTTAAGTMTLETFTAELAAAGVDVEAISATMAAEGRSLENLLAVVNSGRTTVADLAARLNGESSTEIRTVPENDSSDGLLDIRWDASGSVAYNLWVILAATVLVIVIARPIGWFVRQIKRAPQIPSI